MKSIVLSAIFCFFTLYLTAQSFPKVSTVSLEGKQVDLPHANSSKLSVVGLAFSQKAQDDLNSWLNPIYTQFIDKSGFNSMVYDVNVELLIAFTGTAKAARKKAEKKLNEATDKGFKSHVLLWSGDFDTFSDKLGLKSKKDFCLLVIDQTGKVYYQTDGRYTEKKMETLAAIVEN